MLQGARQSKGGRAVAQPPRAARRCHSISPNSAFAERYVDQNRDDCSADAVCILASAILLLNTDLHALVRPAQGCWSCRCLRRA